MAKFVPKDLDKALDQCDLWIRSGKSALARRRIQNFNFRKLPRPLLHRYSSLARRTQLWSLALKALRPIVRPRVNGSVEAFANEKIEYALALWRVGASKEASDLLNDPKLANEPRVWLAKAHGHLHKWEYSQALPLLNQFIQSSAISEYEKTVAQVNRLACLSYLADDSFAATHQVLDEQLKSKGLTLLRANALEIKAQSLLMSRDFAGARATLSSAQELIAMEEGLSKFLVQKWSGILEALISQSPDKLLELRQKAIAMSNWESVRDFDFFHTMLDPQSRWANFAYYGTPFRSFRLKLEDIRSFPKEQVVEQKDHAPDKFDPWFVKNGDGGLAHRCMNLLLRDFYRPTSLGEIFALIHPDQYFDFEASLGRVRQMVSRLNTWIKRSQAPLRLEEHQGSYSLRIKNSGAILCRRAILPVEQTPFLFARLTDKYDAMMSNAEWSAIMGRSEPQTRKVLVKGISEGCVIKFGRGQFTKYQISPGHHAQDPTSPQ